MGGTGSGNRYRWGAKASTDACDRFDLSSLSRRGWLRPGSSGTARWWRGERETSSIGWAVDGEAGTATDLELRYAVEGEEVGYRVPIAWTPCHFGGQRPWFVCPGAGCGRRVGVLYGRRLFLCRRCHDLAYESTREDSGGRALRKARKIRERLGGSANLLEPFPPKPKGMHWRTYARLAREEKAAERVRQAEFAAWLGRTSAWIDRIARDGNDEDEAAPATGNASIRRAERRQGRSS